MSRNRHNLFTTADSVIVAEIMAKVETYGRVTVLAIWRNKKKETKVKAAELAA